MATQSTARAVWQGDLRGGKGTVSTTSGILDEEEVTWAARVERTADATSPEELLAAAHAACFAMALSHALAQDGSTAERLEVAATTSFDRVGEGYRVTSSNLVVRGHVPGIAEGRFAELADEAGEGCPISQALAGNVEITVDASLSGGP
jgi:osmotically inducible protein OsmC